MGRFRSGTGFINWTSFPQDVLAFIEKCEVPPDDDRETYKRVPQHRVLRYIMNTWQCSKPWALKKLRLLVSQRADLSIVVNRQPRKVWSGPHVQRYVSIKKRYRG